MLDILNNIEMPRLEDISDYVRNPLWDKFCNYIIEEYDTQPKFDFSKCSWAPGWNVKFKKSGKTLCTLYPREGFFTVLVVIGNSEKEQFTTLLPELTKDLQDLYYNTKEGMDQRWLMIDLEDEDLIYEDIKRMIALRRNSKKKIK